MRLLKNAWIVLDDDNAVYVLRDGVKVYLQSSNGDKYMDINCQCHEISKDEKTFIAYDNCKHTIREWDIETGRLLRITDSKFERRTKYLQGYGNIEIGRIGEDVMAHNRSTGQVGFLYHGQPVYTFDQIKLLGVTTQTRTAKYWPDVEDLTKFTVINHTADIFDIVFYADHCICGDRNGDLTVWKDGQMVRHAKVHTGTILGVNVHNGKIITRGADSVVIIWNWDTLEPEHILFHVCSIPYPILFSGNWIVTQNDAYTIRIWDICTGKLLFRYFVTNSLREIMFDDGVMTLTFPNEVIQMTYWLIAESVFALSLALEDGDLAVARKLLDLLSP